MPLVFDEDKSGWARSAAITSLSMSVGTANDTVADVGAAFSQATLNDNFRDVGEKINAILAALRDANIIAQD